MEIDEINKWIDELYSMEAKYLPELDHKDCGIIAEILSSCKKYVVFVKHIENH